MAPITIRIRPTTCRSMPASSAVTAKYRIAPVAMQNSAPPIVIA
jgi:hypothetical protein